MGEKQQTKYRIGTLAILILFFVASLFDILTIIPGIGTFTGWMFWTGAGIYFWIAGLGIVNWRIALPGLVSLVAEFFPVIQTFPTILGGVLAIIIISRVEDKSKISIFPKAKPGVRSPPKIVQLNQNGRREARQGEEVIEVEESEELDMAA